jgi:GxxExxY protein
MKLTTEATEIHKGLLINDITRRVIGAAMKVHSELGPGLLESTYEACLAYELKKACLQALTQVDLHVLSDNVKVDLGYRIDILVEDTVILEIKAVEAISPVHEVQLLSYLKLSSKHVGLLINFDVVHLKDGIKRMVNGRGWEH